MEADDTGSTRGRATTAGAGDVSRGYFRTFPPPAITGCGRGCGTRNIVWQCWHLISFPRTSSGTERILRQRRFGQMSWTGIDDTPETLSAIIQRCLNEGERLPNAQR